MRPPIPGSADAKNTFEDLSGVNTVSFSNPYDALIEACHGEPSQLQARYSTHRTTRNAQQKSKLLSPTFEGLILDNILQKIGDPTLDPGFVDPRNCLCTWARPPLQVRTLAGQIQEKLHQLAPHLWIMPLDRLHMTVLELTHSLPNASAITSLINQLGPSAIETLTDYTVTHRSRLIKPLLSYDAAAIALSYVPAAGESQGSTPGPTANHSRATSADTYSYHHLRRDLFSLAVSKGITIESRYVVPSAHLTVGRFVAQEDHDSKEKMERWIRGIEQINEWLIEEFWPRKGESEKGEEAAIREGGEWIVGKERGLHLRRGLLWYGGGETVRLGVGF